MDFSDVKTKFNLDDTVYLKKDDAVIEGTIISIKVDIDVCNSFIGDMRDITIIYTVNLGNYKLEVKECDNMLFSSLEEVGNRDKAIRLMYLENLRSSIIELNKKYNKALEENNEELVRLEKEIEKLKG